MYTKVAPTLIKNVLIHRHVYPNKAFGLDNALNNKMTSSLWVSSVGNAMKQNSKLTCSNTPFIRVRTLEAEQNSSTFKDF